MGPSDIYICKFLLSMIIYVYGHRLIQSGNFLSAEPPCLNCRHELSRSW